MVASKVEYFIMWLVYSCHNQTIHLSSILFEVEVYSHILLLKHLYIVHMEYLLPYSCLVLNVLLLLATIIFPRKEHQTSITGKPPQVVAV